MGGARIFGAVIRDRREWRGRISAAAFRRLTIERRSRNAGRGWYVTGTHGRQTIEEIDLDRPPLPVRRRSPIILGNGNRSKPLFQRRQSSHDQQRYRGFVLSWSTRLHMQNFITRLNYEATRLWSR